MITAPAFCNPPLPRLASWTRYSGTTWRCRRRLIRMGMRMVVVAARHVLMFTMVLVGMYMHMQLVAAWFAGCDDLDAAVLYAA